MTPSLKFDRLAKAVKKNDPISVLELLSDKGISLRGKIDGKNTTVLIEAARCGSPELVKTLLSFPSIRALINEKGDAGLTPLMVAIENGHENVAKLLIRNFADITKTSTTTLETALHLSVKKNLVDVVRHLLSINKSSEFVNMTDIAGDSALHVSVRAGVKPTIFQTLLKNGANLELRNKVNGKTVLHTAILDRNNDIIYIILKSADSKSFLDQQSNQSYTALMTAVLLEDANSVNLLLAAGADPKIVNAYTHENALHLAVSKDCCHILDMLLKASDEYSYLNCIDKYGNTPLKLAVIQERIECIHKLIACNIDPCSESSNGDTVVHSAIKTRNVAILKVIISTPASHPCFSMKNDAQLTPLMLLCKMGYDVGVQEIRRAKIGSFEQVNEHSETNILVACKYGDLKVLKALMLSDRYYLFTQDRQVDLLSSDDLKDASVRGDIPATDEYILTGRTFRKNTGCVPQLGVLFKKNNMNCNVFHACACNHDVDCLKFMFCFFMKFKYCLNGINERNKSGNTPLLMGILNHSAKSVAFLLHVQADFMVRNYKGDHTIRLMTTYLHEAPKLLNGLLNACVESQATDQYLETDAGSIMVDFSVICPQGYLQTEVVYLFHNEIKDKKLLAKVLSNPVLKAFIEIKWTRIKQILWFRFIICLTAVALLTEYFLRLEDIPKKESNSYRLRPRRTVIIATSFLMITIIIPRIWYSVTLTERCFLVILGFLPYALAILIVNMNFSEKATVQLASLAILLIWYSVTLYIDIFPKISYQIALFHEVITSILKFLIVIGITIIAFSLSFYVLYHRFGNYSNPIKSLVYTICVLLPGGGRDPYPLFTIPEFSSSGLTKLDYIKTENCTPINTKSSHNFYNSNFQKHVETLIFIFFQLIVTLQLLNMLVGLSSKKRNPQDLEVRLIRTTTQVKIIRAIEHTSRSHLFKFLKKLGLNYLVVLPRNISRGMVIYPKQKLYLGRSINKELMNKLKNVMNADRLENQF